MLNDAVKKGGLFASSSVGGLSGAFIPVSEDAALADAVQQKHLVLEKLEAMTSVCSVGLDMILIPGDTPPATISGIMADEMAIGVINNKTTATRLIPVPGAKAGDMVHFGGLFGHSRCWKWNAGSVKSSFNSAADPRAAAIFGELTVASSRTLLITSGPTREYLDPVRYLSNASSGRMGRALAAEAIRAGFDVTILSGPVSMTYPAEAHVVPVVSTEEMSTRRSNLPLMTGRFAAAPAIIGRGTIPPQTDERLPDPR